MIYVCNNIIILCLADFVKTIWETFIINNKLNGWT